MEETEKKEIIKVVLNELESRGLIKLKDNSFKNVESLLYNYNKIKESIKDREEQIKDLKEYGLPEKSGSITSIVENVVHENKNDQIENAISSLNQNIYRTKVFIKYIDKVLKKFKDDPYYRIIKLKYFENKGIEYIAEEMQKDTSTISRNKSRLINEIKALLLPNELLSNIFNY